MSTIEDFIQIKNKINNLKKEQNKIESDLLKPYREAFDKKWGKENYAVDLKIFTTVGQVNHYYDRIIKEPFVEIAFVDYYEIPEGDIYDINRIPISHLNSGIFDEEDLTTNKMRQELYEEKKEEEKEKKLYEKLKGKYGN
jgi:hypothetical protein